MGIGHPFIHTRCAHSQTYPKSYSSSSSGALPPFNLYYTCSFFISPNFSLPILALLEFACPSHHLLSLKWKKIVVNFPLRILSKRHIPLTQSLTLAKKEFNTLNRTWDFLCYFLEGLQNKEI